MSNVNYWAVVVSDVVVFVLSSVYYSVFSKQLAAFTRTDPKSMALLLWVGFPVVLLTGSMLHEGVPWQLAALHGGDWLIKLVVIAVILGLWP